MLIKFNSLIWLDLFIGASTVSVNSAIVTVRSLVTILFEWNDTWVTIISHNVCGTTQANNSKPI